MMFLGMDGEGCGGSGVTMICVRRVFIINIIVQYTHIKTITLILTNENMHTLCLLRSIY